MTALMSLAELFAQIPDPRSPRGVRHPVHGILTLVFIGMLGRIREMEVLVRWAKVNWDILREPLGFDRDQPPHATTISRTVARCDLHAFSTAFVTWVKQFIPEASFTVAVDGKTSCQGLDETGQPLQLLTVLAHDLHLILGQWSVGGEKTNEPNVLRNHLAELCAHFPNLELVTGDAIFCQRPLAAELAEENVNYLLQIKGNQPDIEEAVQHCLGAAHETPPAATTVEKRGDRLNAAVCG